MSTKHIDTLIIGSGPGGYVAAVRLGQMGKKVICVEKDSPGGVCLNIGCIPSKALISAAKAYKKLTAPNYYSSMGITVNSPSIDIKQLQQWKGSIVSKLTTSVRQLIQGSGGEFLSGYAEFLDPHTIKVITNTKEEHIITAENIIIATGSRPAQIPGFVVDNDRILDSTGALALNTIPARLLVIGGGYIGLELGMMWAKLGAQVTVVEFTEQLLPGQDPEAVAVIAKAAKNLGMYILLNSKAQGFTANRDGALQVEIINNAVGSDKQNIICDYVLCAVGRRPNVENFGVDKAGIQLDARGFIQVDAHQRTNVAHIYAIGDVCGHPMLAHKASKEAEIAAENIMGHAARMNSVAIPAVVFTEPEMASVGLTESQARQQGLELLIGKYTFAYLGRAMAAMETDGFVKIIANAKNHHILGIHIVGPAATDLISEATLALEMGAVLEDMAWTVHPHPTLGEALMEAAKAALGESPHVLSKK